MTWLIWAANPIRVIRHFRQFGYLITQLTRREVSLRYQGSWLGPLWSLLTPMLMLAVYTFVFSVVFKARWGDDVSGNRVDFAMALFISITMFQLFSETLAAAPGLVIANPNYVKRIVFPLEILPLARLLAGLVQCGLSTVVYAGFMLVLKGYLPSTIAVFPIALLPLVLLTLGSAWALAAIGVFVRDVSQVVGLILMMLMFVSAVFFPFAALPPEWQPILQWNPLVMMLENGRRVAFDGLWPLWGAWAGTMAAGLAVAVVGLAGFMKSKNAFSDVI